MVSKQSDDEGPLLVQAQGHGLETEEGKSVSWSVGCVCGDYQWGRSHQ